MKAALLRLLGSRKSLVAFVAAVARLIAAYSLGDPNELHSAWTDVILLAVALVGAIAFEDFATKWAPATTSTVDAPALTPEQADVLAAYERDKETPKPRSIR